MNYTTQLYWDYNKPLEGSLLNSQHFMVSVSLRGPFSNAAQVIFSSFISAITNAMTQLRNLNRASWPFKQGSCGTPSRNGTAD